MSLDTGYRGPWGRQEVTQVSGCAVAWMPAGHVALTPKTWCTQPTQEAASPTEAGLVPSRPREPATRQQGRQWLSLALAEGTSDTLGRDSGSWAPSHSDKCDSCLLPGDPTLQASAEQGGGAAGCTGVGWAG